MYKSQIVYYILKFEMKNHKFLMKTKIVKFHITSIKTLDKETETFIINMYYMYYVLTHHYKTLLIFVLNEKDQTRSRNIFPSRPLQNH